MTESDEDYSTDTGPEDEILFRHTRKHDVEGTVRKGGEISLRNVTYPSSNNRPRLPDTLKALVPMKKHIVKRLKGRDIDTNISLRVCRAALEMQERYL